MILKSRKVVFLSLMILSLVVTGCTASNSSTSSVPTEPPPPSVARPFGLLSCLPQSNNGFTYRFCQGGMTSSHDLRVKSFDGVPLDADVTLPATGKGPYPLVVLLHGWGLTKTMFETTAPNALFGTPGLNNIALASKGFAVLTYTARGFGESCGTPSSRTAGCAKGWTHIADQRYEIRDTQYLAGLLVDEGLVLPKIAVAGVSYGAGQSMELAMLKNRVRLENGKLETWTSPHGVQMSIGAAFAIWGWDDLTNSLAPNGAYIDSKNTSNSGFYPQSAGSGADFGIPKNSYIQLLFTAASLGYEAPVGVDPTADIVSWQKASLEDLPGNPATVALANEFRNYKSPYGIPPLASGPSPILIANGFTDALFPASEALEFKAQADKADPNAPVSLFFGDIGHPWSDNNSYSSNASGQEGVNFLSQVMQSGKTPTPTVITQSVVCPSTTKPNSILSAANFSDLENGQIVASSQNMSGAFSYGSKLSQTTAFLAGVSGPSTGTISPTGDPALSLKLNDLGFLGNATNFCNPLPNITVAPSGTILDNLSYSTSNSTLLLGSPVVSLKLSQLSSYAEAIAMVWDVSPSGTRQLITDGVELLHPGVSQATFALFPTSYTLAPQDKIELSLMGSDYPSFRSSITTGNYDVTGIAITIPTH
ncbi:MAG: alpha/beta fold hydrolase [Acidimicrobiales bacterium]|nr:alpha/beta fold hydrolase [Acidimicrobiales bacterium]